MSNVDGWLAPATIVAGIGVLTTSMFGLVQILGERRRQREAETPIILCEIEPSRDAPNWLLVILSIENHSLTSWTINSLEVTKPKGVRLVGEAEAQDDSFASRGLSLEKLNEAPVSAVAAIDWPLAPSGRGQARWGPREFAYWRGYLDGGSIRSKNLSMRLTLSSNEPKPRITRIWIHRKVSVVSSSDSEATN